MRKTRKLLRDDRAAAAVEFAIIAPLLLVLVFGIIDFGRALFTLNNLTSAVREGARYAAVRANPGADVALIQARVNSYLATANIGGTVPTATVTLNSVGGSLESITVSIVDYTFDPITPIAELVGLGTISMSPAAEFRWERAP